MGFFSGTKPKIKQVSLLEKSQQPLKNELIGASSGAFGSAADYYKNLLSDNSADAEAFAAPQMRQFNEQIVPDLAEQFAGMGSGGLSSSGFRNAAVNAGADLSERLAAMRADLRSQGASGLQNIGQAGLQRFSENVMTPGSPGFSSQVGPLLGTIGGAALGGPLGASIGSGIGNMFGGSSQKGQTSPYGNAPQTSYTNNGTTQSLRRG